MLTLPNTFSYSSNVKTFTEMGLENCISSEYLENIKEGEGSLCEQRRSTLLKQARFWRW